MDLEEQIEKGKKLVSLGKSLGKDTRALEGRVRALEALLKEDLKKSPERMTDSSIREEVKEVIRDGYDSKLCEMIYPEPNEPKQETSKKNTKQQNIEIKYSKSNLRIEAPDIRSLFLEIKREFPKGSIVLHSGAIYISYFYLPVVLKTLQEMFSRIDVDSAIPALEGVRRFLGMRQVSVEADLAAELENPVTKILLGQKSPEEVTEITRQLKTELKRLRWIDAVWEAVKEVSALTEVINGEEFDCDTKSKVDSRLKETSDVSLTNGKRLPQYQEKGGDKEMGFDIDTEDPIEAGVYDLTISKVETKESKFGLRLEVTFKDEDSRSVNGFFPLPAKLSNKTGLLFKKALGEFKKINSDELIGKKVKALVEHVQRDGRTFVNVTKVL